MKLYTNRGAKHRYGKQRCKTPDNIHFQMKEHEFANPKHVRYRTNVRQTHFVTKNTLQSHLFSMEHTIFDTQPCRSAGHSRHERPTTHILAPEELSRKTAATIHPSMAGCPSPKVRQPTKIEPTTIKKKNTRPNRAQAPPACTHKATSTTSSIHTLVVSKKIPSTKIKRKRATPRARFEHTEVPHTRQVFHGYLHPMSPTTHMACIEID